MAWNDYINKVMTPSTNWWDKKLSDKQRFQLQVPQDVGLLDVASAVPTPVGDVASGLLAAQDVSKGNYGSAALNALGLLPFIPSMGAITAWHGSPAMFDKFDLSKIGTGEGAQAYGHGLYFAENPQVAKTYKMPSRGVESTAATHLNMYKTPENAIAALEEQLTSNITELGRKHTKDAIDLIKSGKATTGNMYKVDIADEAIPNMLDWNKPLSEQNTNVQKALAKIEPNFYNPKSSDYDSSELGQSIYMRLSDLADSKLRKNWVTKRDELLKKGVLNNPELDLHLKSNPNSAQESSNLLNKYGIKGIKYLDEGSRISGEGTKNFVVFDPNIVKILERNKKALK